MDLIFVCFLNSMSFVLGVFLSASMAYLFFWAVVSLLKTKNSPSYFTDNINKFAFIVPAHNEEGNISNTLRSLRNVDYPHEQFDVVVVADNCTDDTALISRSLGATVLERNNLSEKGKGFALMHAFQELLLMDYDAFVIIDADSIVDQNYLRVLDAYLFSGYRVIQSLNGLSNPESSPLTYLFHIGNILENILFYKGKSNLGLPSLLRGNGMCFSRTVLLDYPWDAFSVAEDTEYTIHLVRNGVYIPFASETRVLAHQPENISQAHSQRIRWASGNVKMSKLFAIKLLAEGVFKRRVSLVDTGISLLVLSKPFLLLATLTMLVCTFTNTLFFQQSSWAIYWASVLFLSQVLYVFSGALVDGLSFYKVKFILKMPFYVCWMIFVIILSLFGYKSSSWVRTVRP